MFILATNRNVGIVSLLALLAGCQSVSPVDVSSSGTTVIHSANEDAIQIGDNRGNIDDIRHVAKKYYGDRYRVSFVLDDLPEEPISLNILADSVTQASGGFVCVSAIYVNGTPVGELTNGRSSYDIDVSLINQGENQLSLVSESCKTASGGHTQGIDDIVVKSIEMVME